MQPRGTISKSSFEVFDRCPLSYFIQYKLKKRKQNPNAKADMGTALHCVMECLALIKLNIQNGGPNFIIDKDLGRVDYDPDTWLAPRTMEDDEVEEVNRKRRNKDVFRDRTTAEIKYGNVREGEDLVEELIERAYQFHLKDTIKWVYANTKKKDPFEAQYRQLCWLSLEQFDPRKANVYAVEQEFDVELPWDWARLEDGSQIRIFGYIDIIVEEEGLLKILDYKSGAREVDFKPKTYEAIKKDLQLSLYSYAINQMMPDREVLCELFYIRDGGIFTVYFDPKENEGTIEDTLRTHIEKVRSCDDPDMLSPNIMAMSHSKIMETPFRELPKHGINSFCRYLCPAFQNKSFGDKCDCQFVKEKIQEIGMDQVVEEYCEKFEA